MQSSMTISLLYTTCPSCFILSDHNIKLLWSMIIPFSVISEPHLFYAHSFLYSEYNIVFQWKFWTNGKYIIKSSNTAGDQRKIIGISFGVYIIITYMTPQGRNVITLFIIKSSFYTINRISDRTSPYFTPIR